MHIRDLRHSAVGRSIIAATFGTAFLALPLAACESNDGAEEVGEGIDDAVEETGDAIDEAGDEIEDAVDG